MDLRLGEERGPRQPAQPRPETTLTLAPACGLRGCHAGRLPPVPAPAPSTAVRVPAMCGARGSAGARVWRNDRRRARRAWSEVPDPKHLGEFRGAESRAPRAAAAEEALGQRRALQPPPTGLSTLSAWSGTRRWREDGPSGHLPSVGSGHPSLCLPAACPVLPCVSSQPGAGPGVRAAP